MGLPFKNSCWPGSGRLQPAGDWCPPAEGAGSVKGGPSGPAEGGPEGAPLTGSDPGATRWVPRKTRPIPAATAGIECCEPVTPDLAGVPRRARRCRVGAIRRGGSRTSCVFRGTGARRPLPAAHRAPSRSPPRASRDAPPGTPLRPPGRSAPVCAAPRGERTGQPEDAHAQIEASGSAQAHHPRRRAFGLSRRPRHETRHQAHGHDQPLEHPLEIDQHTKHHRQHVSTSLGMSLSNIAHRGVWGVGRRAFSEVGRSPTDKTTTHVPTPRHLLPTHPSISIFSISLVPILGHPITLVPHRHHTITLSSIPRSGSRSLTTRTRSCGRVVKDAKRSAGEGFGTTQPQCQSHKPRWGTCRTTRRRRDTPHDGQRDSSSRGRHLRRSAT